MTSCLFLKPQVTTAEGRERQRENIRNFIKPAIEQAKLEALNHQVEGLEVADISDDLIKKVFEADVLIIDACCYEASGTFRLSPYLYYCIAIGHMRGNATILVTDSITHLPHNLIRYHTLTYSPADIWTFIDNFKVAVEAIQRGHNQDSPDNPIQSYLHQGKLAEARRTIEQMEAEKSRQGQGKPAGIVFRKVY